MRVCPKVGSDGHVQVLLKAKVISLVAPMTKNSPAMGESWVQFLGWEDPPEKEIATHYSILACEIPWIEEPGGLHSIGSQNSWTQLRN